MDIFFTLICCKKLYGLFENTKNKRKRGRGWTIFLKKNRGVAIASWICMRLPSCCPWFESQAHHLLFYHLKYAIFVMRKERKEAGFGPFKKDNMGSAVYGQWLWLSWQSGQLRHQRSALRIPSSAKYILNIVVLSTVLKRRN